MTEKFQAEIEKAIEKNTAAGDMDKVAELEIALYYFTDADFRRKLEQFVWEANN